MCAVIRVKVCSGRVSALRTRCFLVSARFDPHVSSEIVNVAVVSGSLSFLVFDGLFLFAIVKFSQTPLCMRRVCECGYIMSPNEVVIRK